MPRFFCDEITSDRAMITDEDAKHIAKVLRMRVGDLLTVNDKKGFDYTCEIEEMSEAVSLKIISRQPNETEPSVKITLYQCLPKGDKMEFIIQKAVELGVSCIVPVSSKFCVVKADKDFSSKKLVRYNKIALEAAKQSGRGMIPVVTDILTFDKAIEQAKALPAILFYEGGGARVSDLIAEDTTQAAMFVGSEGGFSEDEVKRAVDCGVRCATLGKLILRCETAPIAGITLLLNCTKNM